MQTLSAQFTKRLMFLVCITSVFGRGETLRRHDVRVNRQGSREYD